VSRKNGTTGILGIILTKFNKHSTLHNDDVSLTSSYACATVEFLERETPEFISPLLCPPNSPDLNPVDYSVWSILQEKVYKTRITDLEDFKRRIRTELAKLDHARTNTRIPFSSYPYQVCWVNSSDKFAIAIVLSDKFADYRLSLPDKNCVG